MANSTINDAIALLDLAIAGRNYGDTPKLWEQIWKNIIIARNLLKKETIDEPIYVYRSQIEERLTFPKLSEPLIIGPKVCIVMYWRKNEFIT